MAVQEISAKLSGTSMLLTYNNQPELVQQLLVAYWVRGPRYHDHIGSALGRGV
jgi:hypothetical protein